MTEMKQQNNPMIVKIFSLFLNNIKSMSENKVILIDEVVIDLDQKHSIRKWIRQNTEFNQTCSRRKYVELSTRIDLEIRQHIEKLQQKQIQKKFKELKKRHAEFMKQIKR